MSKKTAYIVGLSALGIIILYLLIDNVQTKKENERLKEALNSNDLISEKIRQQLIDLLERHPHIDDDIKGELSQIASLLGLQQEVPAVFKLTKIIENLLKRLLKNDSDFTLWIKAKKFKRDFYAHLEYANETKIIDKDDFHIISALKSIRNEEGHELNVKKEQGRLIGAFIAGVSITIGLYDLVKAKGSNLI